jgi:hypothetical protein
MSSFWVQGGAVLVIRGVIGFGLLGLAACSTTSSARPYVPPEEAAWFKFPEEFPAEKSQSLDGTLVSAIQLAMDDFLPRGVQPQRRVTPKALCLQQRQSYDVRAAPLDGDIILVRFATSPGACTRGGPVADSGAIYAVDVRNWRILAVQRP